jgi:hydrogenase-4 membrane subunit HyfE
MVSSTVYKQFPDAVAAVIICIIFPILACIAVGLRVFAQKGIKRNILAADDFFIIAGLVCIITTRARWQERVYDSNLTRTDYIDRIRLPRSMGSY